MLLSLSLIILFGLVINRLFVKISLPGLIGMLVLGIVLGPYGLNWLSADLLAISGDLRKLALIIILLRAGLGLSEKQLRKVGGAAVKFSFIPGIIEGFTVAYFSTVFLNFSFIEGGVLGFIIAAVSPAVVVPHMLKLSSKGIGTKQGIPTLILAGASIDDVFAITLFTAFLGLSQGSQNNLLRQIVNIPISIILGIGIGILSGVIISEIFNRVHIVTTKKVLYLISLAILMTALENWAKDTVNIASLLGVMTMGFILLKKQPDIAQKLSAKMKHIWIFAEILLFVLVGAQVNISVAVNAGLIGLLIITIGLVGRSLGVLIATLGSQLNWKERLFCMIAYSPKATVQAAVGAVPLSAGLASGEIILAIAVLAILFTAPLGAIGIEKTAELLLETENITGSGPPLA